MEFEPDNPIYRAASAQASPGGQPFGSLLSPGPVSEPRVVWQPQPGPQTAFLECPVFDVFFGGARGGGKTEAQIGDWIQHSNEYGEHAIGIFVRRKLTQLSEVIARTQQIFKKLGATYNSQMKTWTMAGGGRLKFVYLERDADAEEYQGHSYCVGVGTPVLMADGSWQAIQTLRTGQLVQTLEGPRRVLSTVAPYRAPCVQATVLAEDGQQVAQQIQPVWHPLASIAALTSPSTGVQPRIPQRFASLEAATHKLCVESLPCAHPGTGGWLSWSANARIGCTGSAGSRPSAPQPPSLSFLGVLHEPSFRQASERASGECATQSRFRDKWSRSRWATAARQTFGWLGRRLLDALGQCLLGRFSPGLPSGSSYGQIETPIVPSLRGRCSAGYGPGGGPSRSLSETGQARTLSPNGVGIQPRGWLTDALGTTPGCNLPGRWSLAHPYTGEARDLSEKVQIARVRLDPVGCSYVCDLEVEGANHYITQGGFVNKNTRVYVEELTNFPSPGPINKLRATLRSGAGVPCCFRATGNPGGPGHKWVKARYIEPAPQGYKVITETETVEIDGVEKVLTIDRVFIPSKLGDNKLLMQNDPTYIMRLRQSGSEALVRAWLTGDWNIVDGAFFDEFDYNVHVLADSWEDLIPHGAHRFRAFDWGSAKPFSVGWYAVSDGTWGLPAGALLKYREWYGAKGPNEGLKMSADLVAKGIVERERHERVRYGVADPSIFIQDGGPSIGETMAVNKCPWTRGDNRRIPGWTELRSRLVGDIDPVDGKLKPMIYFLESCSATIDCLPTLQHDENKPEDVDTESEDHAGDETRYAVMSRPFVPKGRAVPAPDAYGTGKPFGQLTIKEIFQRHLRRLKQADLA